MLNWDNDYKKSTVLSLPSYMDKCVCVSHGVICEQNGKCPRWHISLLKYCTYIHAVSCISALTHHQPADQWQNRIFVHWPVGTRNAESQSRWRRKPTSWVSRGGFWRVCMCVLRSVFLPSAQVYRQRRYFCPSIKWILLPSHSPSHMHIHAHIHTTANSLLSNIMFHNPSFC